MHLYHIELTYISICDPWSQRSTIDVSPFQDEAAHHFMGWYHKKADKARLVHPAVPTDVPRARREQDARALLVCCRYTVATVNCGSDPANDPFVFAELPGALRQRHFHCSGGRLWPGREDPRLQVSQWDWVLTLWLWTGWFNQVRDIAYLISNI